MKWLSLSIVIAVVGCQRPAIYAGAEGVTVTEEPPLVHPSRRVENSLRDRGLGGLVVHASYGGQPRSRVQVEIFPNRAWRNPLRIDSTNARGALTFANLANGTYSGLARSVGARAVPFLFVINGGFVDTLELNLGQAR